MQNENDIFYRYSPFIRDFIYRHGWESLRSVQLDAARCIFETENNLLQRLTQGEHGKTLIFVTHRLAVLEYCNQTLKIENRKE